MQGNQLMPRGKNVLARRAWPGAHTAEVVIDRLNPLKYLRKSAFSRSARIFSACSVGVGGMVVVVGEGGDDAGAQLVGLGMGQFEGGHLLQMVVQQPGVVDQALQDQRLPAGERGCAGRA